MTAKPTILVPFPRPDYVAALEKAGARVANAEVAMVPKTQLDLPPEQAGQVMRLVERLEDLDDVGRVYTNIHLSDEVLAQMAS